MKTVFKLAVLLLLPFQGLAQEILSDFTNSTPTVENVDASGILSFIETVEASEHELRRMMVLHHGKIVAEGWCKPYGPGLAHNDFSPSLLNFSLEYGFVKHIYRYVNQLHINF